MYCQFGVLLELVAVSSVQLQMLSLLSLPFSSDLSVFAVILLSFLFVLYFLICLSHVFILAVRETKAEGLGFLKGLLATKI